jgi:adenosylhomocysteine nucleosidase
MPQTVVLISANTEWCAVKELFASVRFEQTPFGETFVAGENNDFALAPNTVFVHGGCGKISAAASTQYAIGRWKPDLLFNIGTCGGFEGKVAKHAVILASETIVYDIYERMGFPEETLRFYSAKTGACDLSGGYPHPVIIAPLVSADRDLDGTELEMLHAKYGAVAGDWESGAIAWVANRNDLKAIILRGVSDLVWHDGGEAYDGNIGVFRESAREIMSLLVKNLHRWIEIATTNSNS